MVKNSTRSKTEANRSVTSEQTQTANRDHVIKSSRPVKEWTIAIVESTSPWTTKSDKIDHSMIWVCFDFSPAAMKSTHHLCVSIKSSSLPTILPPQALCSEWKQNKSVVVFTVFGVTMLLGFWAIHHALSLLATGGCEQSAGGSRISVTGVRRMAVCPGLGGGVGDPWPLWEEAILTDSRAGIMNSIKRQAASKARQDKQ